MRCTCGEAIAKTSARRPTLTGGYGGGPWTGGTRVAVLFGTGVMGGETCVDRPSTSSVSGRHYVTAHLSVATSQEAVCEMSRTRVSTDLTDWMQGRHDTWATASFTSGARGGSPGWLGEGGLIAVAPAPLVEGSFCGPGTWRYEVFARGLRGARTIRATLAPAWKRQCPWISSRGIVFTPSLRLHLASRAGGRHGSVLRGGEGTSPSRPS